MFTLQKLSMPQTDVCMIDDMYFRIKDDEKVKFDYENSKYIFKKDGELSGNTYFNAFSSSKWHKYTVIDEVGISLQLKGSFELSLVKCFLADMETIESIVKQVSFSSDAIEECIFKYNYSLDQFDGFYYIKIKSLTDESIFYGGQYFTTISPTCSVKIGAVICTYKREKFIYKNLELFKTRFLLNESSSLQKNLDLFVIDNAGSLDDTPFDHNQLHLIRNKNVGGAGGFTRGLIEVLKKNALYTHVLFMDDDALLDVSSLEKTFYFLSYLKNEHRDLYIGGATLRLDKQNIQLEAGAVWNNNLLFNIKPNLNLSLVHDILLNELEESRSYNAWVFTCIPLITISDNNLPLPLFVRGDDMEFGLRNSKKILAMNGICAWHAPLHNKYSSFMLYYTLRNQLILNAIYDKNFTVNSAITLLRQNLIRELLFYRYENVDLIFKAFKDFLQGVPFFLKTDGEKLHKEIMSFAPPMKDFHELSRTDTPFLYAKLNVSYQQVDGGKFKRILRKLSFNGYFLPMQLYKKNGWDNYGIVELTSAKPINFFRRKKVLQVDLVAGKGYITQINKKKFVKTWILFYRFVSKMKAGAYSKAIKSYYENRTKISNLKFWETYLGLADRK